jgi:light-regulated signal transduction histidine kinase (bacteriophytochrome)
MEPINETLDATCLQVFGKISAAVSHDLKNVLAIINESAGLLDDLALRAAKGIEIPPDRLNVATARILKQVKRGDTVLKNLNRFAHTTDAPILQTNVAETMALMVDLAGRQAAMKEIALTVTPAGCVATTRLVYLEAFVYQLLRHVIETLPRREAVMIEVTDGGEAVHIRLTNAAGLPLVADEVFPAEQEKALMQRLRIGMVTAPGAVTVQLPLQRGE